MSVRVTFNILGNIDRGGRRGIVTSWTKTFPSNDEVETELAFGYIVGLGTLRGFFGNDKVNMVVEQYAPMGQGRIMSSGILTNFKPVQDRLIGLVVDAPEPGEPFLRYVDRVGMRTPNPMNYNVILMRPGAEAAIVYQFNHPTFLQGYLSVLTATNIPIENEIAAIYDRNGNQYEIQ